jgi:hypothetical protein
MNRTLTIPRRFAHFAAVLCGLALAACGAPTLPGSLSGAAELQVLALSSSDVVSVSVTVSGAALGAPRTSSLFPQGSQWGGLLGGLPVGTGYTFTAIAKDGTGTPIYTGAVSNVTISSGQTVAVVITAQQATPPVPFENAVPVIDSLVIGATNVVPGAQVSVKVAAHDPNRQDTLTFQWQATCGTFANATAVSTTWTAPTSSGSCTVSIKVSDQRGATVSAAVAVNVDNANGKGQAQLSVSMNTWPVVTNVTAAPNGYLVAAIATTLTVTASDADNDPLAYAWTSTCTGAFSATNVAGPTFTVAAGQTGACTLTVAVSDGRGGSTTGDITLPIGQPTVNQAPVIVDYVQSTTTANSGQTINLLVDASDPEGTALTFQWSANGGTFSGESDSATSSSVAWIAPDTATGDWQATVNVTDAQGATTAQVFTISPAGPAVFQFVYTSDQHYGITRTAFRGGTNVDSHIVNAAMVAEMNTLPGTIFPSDSGVRAGSPVGAIDMVIETGDIANRMEVVSNVQVQSAAASWAQFSIDYINGLNLFDQSSNRAPLWLAPGNHDVSNAIGYYTPMVPTTDATSMAGIYNFMLNPAVPLTASTYNYAADKIHYSKDLGGIHMAFLNMWPDSGERAWLGNDLAAVNPRTPVLIFVHDPPAVDSKHFINPNGLHDINTVDKFENLLVDQLADGTTINAPSTIEQRAFATFLKAHKNVVAYFHGHTNYTQYYDWNGPDGDVVLHAIRVDSPMKGNYSATDETQLSFEMVSIDTRAKQMTVRECLWNKTPKAPAPMPIVWGLSETLSLVPPL